MGTFSQEEITILVCGTVLLAFLGLLSAFVGLQSWNFRGEFWMKSRWSPQALVLIHGLSALHVSVRCPAVLWVGVWVGQREMSEMSLSQRRVEVLLVLLTAAYSFGVALLIASRFWHQYYAANLAVEVGVAKWKQMIDASLLTAKSSWFLTHQHSLGNRLLLLKWTAALWLLLIFCSFIIAIFLSRAGSTLMIVVITTLILALALTFRLRHPVFEDRIYLKSEMRTAVAAMFCYTCAWVPLFAAGHCTNAMSDKRTVVFALMAAIRQLLNCGVIVALQFTASNLVIGKFVLPETVACGVFPLTFPRPKSGMRLLSSTLEMTTPIGSHSPRSSPRFSPRSRSKDKGKVGFYDILRSQTGFRLFMAHLFKEFSVENMLCLIECCKFKEKLQETNVTPAPRHAASLAPTPIASLFDVSQSFDGLVFFCEEVDNTQSTAVGKLKDDNGNAAEVAHELAVKYIRDGATLCVNLSGRTRRKALQAIGEALESEKQLGADVFNAVITECIGLLKSSFSRFKGTDDFTTLVNEFGKELL